MTELFNKQTTKKLFSKIKSPVLSSSWPLMGQIRPRFESICGKAMTQCVLTLLSFSYFLPTWNLDKTTVLQMDKVNTLIWREKRYHFLKSLKHFFPLLVLLLTTCITIYCLQHCYLHPGCWGILFCQALLPSGAESYFISTDIGLQSTSPISCLLSPWNLSF